MKKIILLLLLGILFSCDNKSTEICVTTKNYSFGNSNIIIDTIYWDEANYVAINNNNDEYLRYDSLFRVEYDQLLLNKELIFEDEKYKIQKDTVANLFNRTIRLLLISWESNCTSYLYFIFSDKLGLLEMFGETGGSTQEKIKISNYKDVFEIKTNQLRDSIKKRGLLFPKPVLPSSLKNIKGE